MKGLVVDDSATMRRILRLGLRACGCDEVVEASSAAEALALGEQAMDVVIADDGLPDMDGTAFVRGLRETQWGATSRVMLVSDRSRRADVEAAVAAGVRAYLLRPFTLDALKDRIAWLVQPAEGAGAADGAAGPRPAVEPGPAGAKEGALPDEATAQVVVKGSDADGEATEAKAA